MNNQPGTPRDDGEMSGNFLNPFQSDNVCMKNVFPLNPMFTIPISVTENWAALSFDFSMQYSPNMTVSVWMDRHGSGSAEKQNLHLSDFLFSLFNMDYCELFCRAILCTPKLNKPKQAMKGGSESQVALYYCHIMVYVCVPSICSDTGGKRFFYDFLPQDHWISAHCQYWWNN